MAVKRGKREQNVVSLHGVAIPIPRPSARVIRELELVLQEARDGNIAGFGVFLVHPQQRLTTILCGAADQHMMIAGSALLHNKTLRGVLTEQAGER